MTQERSDLVFLRSHDIPVYAKFSWADDTLSKRDDMRVPNMASAHKSSEASAPDRITWHRRPTTYPKHVPYSKDTDENYNEPDSLQKALRESLDDLRGCTFQELDEAHQEKIRDRIWHCLRIRYGRTCLCFSAAALDSKTHNQATRRAHHNGIVGQRGRTILTLYIDDRLADTAFVPTISSRSNLYGVAAFPFDDYTHRFVQMASLMDVYYAAVHQASTYTVYPYTRSCLIHDAGIRSNDSQVCASTSMAAMQGPDVYPFDVPLPCFTASLHPYISCRKHVKIRLRSRHSQVLLPHPVHAP